MIFRVLGFAHIVEHRGGTKPDPFGVAHAVQRLKLVEKTQGQSRNLERVIRFKAVCFADSDDGVDDLSASHVASFNSQFFLTGWYSLLFISEERARSYCYSLTRLSFLPCHRLLSHGQPNHHLLP